MEKAAENKKQKIPAAFLLPGERWRLVKMDSLPPLTEKQKQMIEYGIKHPYSLLCADPRLGKSRAAIVLQQKRNANCVIVCPSYLITNWKKEINKWAPKASVTMFRKGKDIYDVCDSDFVVTSYDLAQKAEMVFEWADMVVADEIHNLKSMDSRRSQFFHRVVYENSIKYLHGLTGTPLKNRVKEFYSLIALTNYDPQQKDHSFLEEYPDEITFAEYFSYAETYNVRVSNKRGGWEMPVTTYSGLRNEKELKEWLKDKYIRIRAEAGDLPPISYLDTLVSDIDDDKLLESFKAFFNSEQKVKQSIRVGDITEHESRKLRTGSVLPEHKRNAAVQKVPFTIKYVEDLLQSIECCLIYSDHREPCQQLAKHFGVLPITGENDGHEKKSTG